MSLLIVEAERICEYKILHLRGLSAFSASEIAVMAEMSRKPNLLQWDISAIL